MANRYNFIIVPLLFLVLLGASACGPDALSDETKALPDKAWGVDDTLGFPFSIEDTTAMYDLYISLRHTTDYAYRNLFLFVDTHFPDGSISRDTLEFILAKPDGTWLGKGFSKIKYNRFLIRKGVVFPESGDYRFVFQHAMRTESLAGMRNLGVRIGKSDVKRQRP